VPKDVDTEYLQRLRRAAIAHAMKRGHHLQDAEDFASHCVLHALTNNTAVNFKWLLINWDKSQNGDMQTVCGRLKRMENLYADAVCPTGVGADETGDVTGVVPSVNPTPLVSEALKFMDRLSPELGPVARLLVLFGFTQREIALALGIPKDLASERCQVVRDLLFQHTAQSQ
jgi:hypothetical protein